MPNNINDINILIEYYKSHTTRETISKFHIRLNRLNKILQENGVDLHPKNKTSVDTEAIISYYSTHSANNTCKKFCITKCRLNKILEQNDVAIRTEHDNRSIAQTAKVDACLLIEFYKVHNITETAIAFNTTIAKVKKILLDYNIELHSTDYIKQLKQKKQQQTFLTKYGVKNPFQSASVKEKIANTNLNKYGVDNISKLRDTAVKKSKNQLNIFAADGEQFDSKWELLVYNKALEQNCKIERQIPIEYDDHVTFIDFRINGKLYEVKGNHLLNGYIGRTDINKKLDVYAKNNITVITDTKNINNYRLDITYLDIHELKWETN